MRFESDSNHIVICSGVCGVCPKKGSTDPFLFLYSPGTPSPKLPHASESITSASSRTRVFTPRQSMMRFFARSCRPREAGEGPGETPRHRKDPKGPKNRKGPVQRPKSSEGRLGTSLTQQKEKESKSKKRAVRLGLWKKTTRSAGIWKGMLGKCANWGGLILPGLELFCHLGCF